MNTFIIQGQTYSRIHYDSITRLKHDNRWNCFSKRFSSTVFVNIQNVNVWQGNCIGVSFACFSTNCIVLIGLENNSLQINHRPARKRLQNQKKAWTKQNTNKQICKVVIKQNSRYIKSLCIFIK